MKRIAIFTTSRAEFGLLSNLIEAINNSNKLEYLLIAGGSHHLSSQGKTIEEIQGMGYSPIPFDFFLSSDSDKSLAQSLAIEQFQLSEIFTNNSFDIIAILGDRIELLPIVQTSIVYRKPIIHIHGGEITEGAIDNQIRHMITKASHLHFCATEEYKQNIINMGEESWRVFNIGALSIDSIKKRNKLSKIELYKKYNLVLNKPTVLFTYHPVTLEKGISAIIQIKNIFEALDSYDFQIMITAPNMDTENHFIFEEICNQISKKTDYHFIESMGMLNYQSMIPHVEFVIGNSSSGIIEGPFYRIPTINIGDRQKGRIRHSSVIDTGYEVSEIKKGIDKALDSNFRASLLDMDYKFGDGHAAERIVDILMKIPIDSKLLIKRMEFQYE